MSGAAGSPAAVLVPASIIQNLRLLTAVELRLVLRLWDQGAACVVLTELAWVEWSGLSAHLMHSAISGLSAKGVLLVNDDKSLTFNLPAWDAYVESRRRA